MNSVFRMPLFFFSLSLFLYENIAQSAIDVWCNNNIVK